MSILECSMYNYFNYIVYKSLYIPGFLKADHIIILGNRMNACMI